MLVYGLIFFSCACTARKFHPAWTREKSPAIFTIRFNTSKGSFDVQVYRDWSPLAADRLYQLIKHHYYDNGIFYRVVPRFVAQFGNSDSVLQSQWAKFKLPDEAVRQSNKKATISFARAGKETRGSELFINLQDNPRLDTLNYEGVTGFPPFGRVIDGMEVVEALYGGYGDSTMKVLDTLYINRSIFLKKFPRLDSIRSVILAK